MVINHMIAQLKANRHMRSREEVITFDEILSKLASRPQDEIRQYLPNLLMVFDDSSGHQEVMWSLLHYIEHFDLETELRALGEILPLMSNHASIWAARLVNRMLNSEQARKMLKEILPTLPATSQVSVRQVLNDIAKWDAEKRVQVEAVLGTNTSS